LYTNPADHLLDVITPSKPGAINTVLKEQAATDQAIIQCQAPVDIDLNMGEDKRLVQQASLPVNPTWLRQVYVLLQRNFQEQARKWKVIAISLVQTIIMAVLIGTVFLQIGKTQTSIVRREPVIFFCVINQGVFGALTVINSFPVERTLTLRERASGTYFASAYFSAKIIADTLIQLPIPIVFVSELIFDCTKADCILYSLSLCTSSSA
jgi:ATP-binding cassette subfamily G (WHITE) protein 2